MRVGGTVHRNAWINGLGAGACFALACLVAACDGGEQLSVEEYFARVDALDEARAREMRELQIELESLAPNDAQGGLDVLTRQTDAREAFVDGLDDLDEPDEVQGLHEGAVSTLRRAVEAFRAYIEDNQDAQNVFDLLTGFAGVDFDAINAAYEQCKELEGAAGREGITIELSCDE
jgi:hypothetical protein